MSPSPLSLHLNPLVLIKIQIRENGIKDSNTFELSQLQFVFGSYLEGSKHFVQLLGSFGSKLGIIHDLQSEGLYNLLIHSSQLLFSEESYNLLIHSSQLSEESYNGLIHFKHLLSSEGSYELLIHNLQSVFISYNSLLQK